MKSSLTFLLADACEWLELSRLGRASLLALALTRGAALMCTEIDSRPSDIPCTSITSALTNTLIEPAGIGLINLASFVLWST